jgi:hypothetical protein
MLSNSDLTAELEWVVRKLVALEAELDTVRKAHSPTWPARPAAVIASQWTRDDAPPPGVLAILTALAK